MELLFVRAYPQRGKLSQIIKFYRDKAKYSPYSGFHFAVGKMKTQNS